MMNPESQIPPDAPHLGRLLPRPPRGGSPWWGIAAVIAAVATVALAYVSLRSDLNARYTATQEELEGIHAELRQIRQELESDDGSQDQDEEETVPAVNTVRFDVKGYPFLGNAKASLVMVEFTDFQCPYCARYHASSYPHLKQAYVDTQRMRYVTVDYPLDFHPLAFKAAEAAHCAGNQGKYWDAHDRLFKAAPKLAPEDLPAIVAGLGLNMASFKSCLDSSATADIVKRGVSEGDALGVEGTPTFIIGRAEGSVVRGRLVVGAYPTKVFDDIIQQHLVLK